ncbi:hypothetical protein AB9K35_03990, partial [Leisingera sp. XS_AS12]|uniref:hypothetical protein n=1 Tax=Leisingera sp. XS_AS12 TaxID=3241294 RepID=UPI003514ACAE
VLTYPTAKSALPFCGDRILNSGTGASPPLDQDWLPSPDPVYAEMIRHTWTARPAAAPALESS